MEKMIIYDQVKEVPAEAKKTIKGGRLNGMTDIKPMWRIQKLTEVFGPCGIGWKTIIKNKEIIEGANEEKIAIVDIYLYVKLDGVWSDAIEGTGGSSFISKESKGLYTSDECFKMAYTDALSVACKSLGMGADVYWGDNKYNTNAKGKQNTAKKDSSDKGENLDRVKLFSEINELELELDIPHEKTLKICKVKSLNELSDLQLKQCIEAMQKLKGDRENERNDQSREQ